MASFCVRGPLATAALLLTVIGVSLQGNQNQTGSRGITPEDYYAFEFFSDPQLSPDGALVAYVVTTSDRRTRRSRSSIWAVRADGKATAWELTPGPSSSSAPRWSPDGEVLAFLSARPTADAPREPQGRQVYLLSPRGGEARRLTSLQNGVTSLEWSPDGKRLAVTTRTGPDDEEPGESRSARIGRHITQTVYKSPGPSSWLDHRRTHIWVVDVSTGATKQVTNGNDWDDGEPQWSPDGTRIAFVSDRTGLSYEARGEDDVYVVSLTTGAVTRVSRHERAKHPRIPAPGLWNPRWSPDGQQIAYVAAVDYESFPSIWLAPAQGESPPIQFRQDLDCRLRTCNGPTRVGAFSSRRTPGASATSSGPTRRPDRSRP